MANPRQRRPRARPLAKLTRFARTGSQNVLEAVRLSRLAASGASPYEVVAHDALHRLRRYARNESAHGPRAALLLVPPLMLTAEIYDISADLSAIAPLAAAGVDCWVVDFGSPEREEGGMSRTLDDHVRTVAGAVRKVREVTGRDVHLAGYSQGGMFAYQAAAYLRSEGLASLITFGSPVDVHRNVPFVHGDDLAALVLRGARSVLDVPLKHIEGLPGVLTSTAFKLLTPRKEVEQMFDLVLRLWDRQELEKRAARRKFLGGEGFVAWPGPALRTFVDELIVQNRMIAGGIVIDGRTLTLADIRCPILTVVGLRDEIALPASVRGIRRAAPHAEVREIAVEAGHFGLVVGSRALRETWPSVREWMRWRDEGGPIPSRLVPESPGAPPREEEWETGSDAWDFAVSFDRDLVRDAVRSTLGNAAGRVTDLFGDATQNATALRWQVPKLRRLGRIGRDTRVSLSHELARRAAKSPDATFFLWSGRAFSFRSADERVTHVAKGLLACDVGRGARVGVVMLGRPSLLSGVCAIGRLGAVAVIAPHDAGDDELVRAFRDEEVGAVLTDPENAARMQRLFPRVLVLGGVGSGGRALPEGVVDMEAIDTAQREFPPGFVPDAGLAQDLSMVLLTRSARGGLRASPVTNHRWAFSALGAAAACTLGPHDTVYVCLPLHHPAGLLVAVSSAVAAGARLALGSDFSPETFFPEVRRYGATIVFYAGDMLRALLAQPPSPADRSHPLRLAAGSGMRADVARAVRERFGLGVLEIYASTSHHVVMVDAAGEKPGAVGRPLPGTAEVFLARWDFGLGTLARDTRGRAIASEPGEPGAALVRLDARHGDGAPLEPARIVSSVRESGDQFYVLRDVLARDADGDHFYLGTLDEAALRGETLVFPRTVEDVLYRVPGVERAIVQARRAPEGGTVLVASVQLARTQPIAEDGLPALDVAALATLVDDHLPPAARPDFVRVVPKLDISAGFRVLAPALPAELRAERGVRLLVRRGEGYAPAG
jgi:putative long chain acyl-CoA synthase